MYLMLFHLTARIGLQIHPSKEPAQHYYHLKIQALLIIAHGFTHQVMNKRHYSKKRLK